MSDQINHPKKYSELRNIFKYYIDSYTTLYQLKTENTEELNSIYKMIKTELIDSNKYLPKIIIKDILNIIPYNNRYTKSYLSLAKLIYDDYNVCEVNNVEDVSNFLFYKEYGIKLNKIYDFGKIQSENLEILTEDTIYRAIMYNDLKKLISFTDIKGFKDMEKLQSSLYPYPEFGYSYLELCCYYGAVDCFKFLITKFYAQISLRCLYLSFLGKNPEIMSECLKHYKPDDYCMMYAIISHNIDFVTFLMNEYDIQIDLRDCGIYKNLDSFLVYLDQTNAIKTCFVNSARFNIPSFCEYFLSLGVKVNVKIEGGLTALHIAAWENCKETVEFLFLHGAKIKEKEDAGRTALHLAARKQSKETVEFLISHGININEKTNVGDTALHVAAVNNRKEIAEILISNGIKINEKNDFNRTALHYTASEKSKETAELLISHHAKVNEKDLNGKTPLHYAAQENDKEIVEILISHGANINEIDIYGYTALSIAKYRGFKEMAELLLSHGADINVKRKSSSSKCNIF
ncbi:hypothetical protein TVAG_040920 [Trichomonas vaginalis G3]|uniref:DUF3447 domain-containing protein n=1 Tax=Trichomonas vaginalis (strain ATCC PRA-98 / G3) TaxID=412133 RepID=A2EWQ4_TRIV3|nr:spectrin binding [Trichomonas vaginalis G3]EAY02942.1 hypothetical protein TVAG_040920 [Trichomonas vaginalis G3]KAI5521792.1 spectrin binding [Trichomonas vaginalis G3]|eukprot:XP_001315165.1 hypothetical protein [Trichomonas vaginalis G3]